LSLPTVAITTPLAFNIIPVTLGVGFAFAAVLLVLVYLGWLIATANFDRERLTTNSRS
jgi:hypothetical protein